MEECMKKVMAYICLAAFLFGTMEVALKTAGDSLDSIQLTFLRFLIGGIILFPVGIRKRQQGGMKLTKSDHGWMTLVGIVGVPVSMLCFQLGVERCNAATAASLICLNPLFTMLIAHFFTDEKMTALKSFAFLIGLVSAVLLIRPWDMQSGNTLAGIVLMMAASVTFAAYTVMGKRTVARMGTFFQTGYGFIAGSLVLLVVLLVSDRPVFEGVLDNFRIVMYCGIFVTGLGYMFFFLAIRHSDASTGAVAFFIKPAIAPVLAIIFLHEKIFWNTVAGVLLLMAASFISLYDTRLQSKTSGSKREDTVS